MIRIFRHYISKAYLGLFVAEFLVFFSAMRYGHELRFLGAESWYSDKYMLLASIIFAVVLSLSNIGIGLYRRSLSWQDYKLLSRLAVSFTVATLMLVIIYYAFPEFKIARGVLLYALLLAFAGMLVIRFVFYKFVKSSRLRKNILVIGAGKKARKLMASNERYLHKSYDVLACLALDENVIPPENIRVISDADQLLATALEYDIDEIVVAVDDRRSHLPMDELLDCKVYGIDVVDLVTFYEREQAMIDLENNFSVVGLFFPMALPAAIFVR